MHALRVSGAASLGLDSKLRTSMLDSGLQIAEVIQCPFCGQCFELVVDTSVQSQRFTTDCEICCRPFEVSVECEPGDILSLDVMSN